MDKPAIFFITLSLTASLLICVHTAPHSIIRNEGTQSDANIQPNVVRDTAVPQTGTPNDKIHQNDNSLESGNEVDDEDNVSNEGSVTANDNSVSVLRKSEEEDIIKSNDNVDVDDDDEDDEEDDDESSDEDDIVAGPGVKYHVINEDFGVREEEEKKNGVKDPMSILDEGSEDEGVLNRGLSDDVIIDALFTNIDTVQDQLEICEEGLRQKLLSSTPHMLMRREPVELDDETKDDVFDNNVKEPGQVFDDSSDEDSESDEDSKSVEDFDDGDDDDDDDDDDDVDDDDSDDVDDDDYDYDSDSEDFDDSDEDDDDSEEEDMYKNTVRTRRSASSPSSQYVNAVSKTRPDPAVQVIMNRLSSRLEYLKKSLRQCYVLFKNMD